MGSPRVNMSGLRFGRLTALEYVGGAKWKLTCDCGNETVVSAPKAKSGHTKSCGCLKALGLPTKGMGATEKPTYNSWHSMQKRCYDETHDSYGYYGAQGITVCQEWRQVTDGVHPFVRFLNDMGPRPSLKHTLDRIDGSGNYEKSNCRWATRKRQQRNRRTTLCAEYDGALVPLADLAERFDIRLATLRARINSGWEVHDALHTPVNENFHPKLNDQTRAEIVSLRVKMGSKDIARQLQVCETTVHRVLREEARRVI